ncbi:MAG: alpha/beta hydrolase [Asticcacaulis sp.]
MRYKAIVASVCVLVLSGSAANADPQPYKDLHINPDLLRPQLTDIGDGRRLHMACEGQGAPMVLFEQGGEGAIPNWRRVQPVIAKITRTCVYDRTGFGLSDPPTAPITGTSTTDDLHKLLEARGETSPFIIAGHSIGGFYGTLYANRFPEDVAGLVLVDSGFAGQNNPKDPEDRRLLLEGIDKGNQGLRDCADMARQNLLTPDDLKGCFKLPSGLSEAEKHYMAQALIRPEWHEAELSQSLNYFPSWGRDESHMWREERLTRRDFADMPLIVLSAGRMYRDPAQSDAGFAEFTADWRAGHEEVATRSREGEFIYIPDAGHFIQHNRPDIVIDAITRVITKVRASEK